MDVGVFEGVGSDAESVRVLDGFWGGGMNEGVTHRKFA